MISELRELQPFLTPQERVEIEKLLAGSKSVMWQPQKGPQSRALQSEADILGYGGAAGGGKSDLLLGTALTRHRKSIIFRREAVQLQDIVDRGREIVGDAGVLNLNTLTWKLPGGRKVRFAGVKQEADLGKWKGRPHDFYGFDEATEFSEKMVRFLITWLRSTIQGQRCRVILTFNPPTDAQGRWVIRFFAPWLDPKHPNPAKPGELRWYAQVDGAEVERPDGQPFEHNGEWLQPMSRTFIPALLDDNAYLADTNYRAVLQNLPEPLRSQMLRGDFSAGIEDDVWQVIPTSWVQAAIARWTADGRPTIETEVDGEMKKVPAPLTCVGVDVARGGAAQTVLSRRYGTWYAKLEKHPGKSTPDGPGVALLVIKALTEGGYANIDAIGVGASVYDQCRQQEANVNAVIVSKATPMRDRTNRLTFANLRAWAWWRLREALDPDTGDNLALPDDPEMLADLTSPRYSLRVNGIAVEPKDDVEKRVGGRSVDSGEAVLLSSLPYMGAVLG